MTNVLLAFTSSNIGGAEQSLIRLFNSETFSRVRGEIFFWQKGGPAERLIETCSQVDSKKEVSVLVFWFSKLFGLDDLYKASLRNDVVYLIGWRLSLIFRIINLMGAERSLIVGVRWVPASKMWLDVLFRHVEPVLQRFVSGYICNSHAAAKVMIENGINPMKIKVVHNGSEMPEFGDLRENLSQCSRVQIITVANHAPRKGLVEYLNNVVAPIVKDKPDVLFYFVGRDDMNGSVKNEILKLKLESNVKLIAYTTSVDEYLKVSTVMVLPSLYGEGCPTSVIEAMSYGVPALGFDILGMNECIVDGKTGFLVEKFNYEDLKEKIYLLINDAELRDQFRRGSREYFSQHFQLLTACEKHVEAILDLDRST